MERAPFGLRQYIDPIIQSTFNNDGSLQEIVKALSVRLRDSNSTVSFQIIESG